MYDRFKVDIVLQGHDHTYARSKLMQHENVSAGVNVQTEDAGTMYVVSVSGPKMYDVGGQPYFRKTAANTKLYQIIFVDGDELRYEARTAVGRLYDAFTLQKRAGQSNLLIERDALPAEKK